MERNVRTRRAAWVIACAALIYSGLGFLPGRVLLPADLIREAGVWKSDPLERRPVSNRLLSDPVLQFHPWDTAARRWLARGQLPFVNPFAGEGQALFANPQAALLCPFTWPRILLGPRGWAVSVFLKILVAGLGVCALAREMGAGSTAAVLSGLVAAASGFSILWALHPHTNVFAALPWLAAALLRCVREPSRLSTVAVVVASLAAAVGGHPETLAVGLVGIAFFVTWEALAEVPRPPAPLRRLAGAAAAAACGFLLASIELIPFLRLLAGSRAVALRPNLSGGGIRWAAAVSQILPGFLGAPLGNELDLSGVSASAENFNSRGQGYVGAIVLLLLAISGRRLAPAFRRGLCVGAFGLVLAWKVPPFEPLLARVPLLSLGARQYWAVLFVLFASAAAGPALLETTSLPRGRRAVLALTGFALLAAGILPTVPSARGLLLAVGESAITNLRARGRLMQPAEVYRGRLEEYLRTGRWTAIRRLALPGACFLLAGWALADTVRRRRLLVGAALAEVAVFGVGYLPAVDAAYLRGEAPAIRDVKRLDPEGLGMVASAEGIYPPNLATLDRVRDVVSFDVLEDSRRTERLKSCGFQEAKGAFGPDSSAACLADLGVRFFLSREPLLGTVRVGGAPPPAVGVYEMPNAREEPLPTNTPPKGLPLGVAVSGLALAGSAILIGKVKRSEATGAAPPIRSGGGNP